MQVGSRWVRLGVIVCMLLLGLSVQAEDELSFRTRLKLQVQQSLQRERFDDLEKVAQIFRERQTRTGSGVWALTQFYMSFSWMDLANDQHWQQVENTLLRWQKNFPTSPTPVIAYVEALTERGSQIRSDRGQEQASLFWKRGYNLLLHTKSFSDKDPSWYVQIGYAGCTHNWQPQEFDKLLEEGMARFPAHYQMYFAALEYYRCNTTDFPHRLEVIASRAARNNKATDGDGPYARVYWFAAEAYFGDRLFRETMVDWTRMKNAMDDVLRQYPDQWNVNNFAYFACLKGDKTKARELVGRVTTPIMEVWDSEERFKRCKYWANQGVKSA